MANSIPSHPFGVLARFATVPPVPGFPEPAPAQGTTVVGEYFLTTMREAAVSVSADRGGAPVVDVHAGELATHRSMGGAVVLLGAVSIRLDRGCGCQREDGRGGRAESFEHGKRSDMFMISSSAGVFSLNRSSRTLQIGMQGPFAGVVQHLLVSGYTGVREAASLPDLRGSHI